MAKTNEIFEEELRVEECNGKSSSKIGSFCSSPYVVCIAQKLMAEAMGTYFIIFAGCGSVVVNNLYDDIVTFPGICVTWGLIVMVMVYSLGHISGAHFNPAVTLTFSIFRHFPYKEVPLYMIAQIFGSLLASGTLCVMFDVTPKAFFGTVPSGSNAQSFAMEIIISFLLMFVISGVATDSRAIGEMAGIAVGMTIVLNVFVAGPISGASMNPARSLGPAVMTQNFKGLWVYLIGPPIGTIAGGFAYNLIRFTDKPLKEIAIKSSTFLRNPSSIRK
ncbi:probable aquaporin NIP-type [Spinacia oleracea]|uniref:Probable aquaporin NIP-type n=1 Tax=Spinacia oleracea TaxID=3562 RepID=A0A9R0KBM6_SPIOL|nr:probable aquaporin NIP-type [Spinacia oleracea]